MTNIRKRQSTVVKFRASVKEDGGQRGSKELTGEVEDDDDEEEEKEEEESHPGLLADFIERLTAANARREAAEKQERADGKGEKKANYLAPTMNIKKGLSQEAKEMLVRERLVAEMMSDLTRFWKTADGTYAWPKTGATAMVDRGRAVIKEKHWSNALKSELHPRQRGPGKVLAVARAVAPTAVSTVVVRVGQAAVLMVALLLVGLAVVPASAPCRHSLIDRSGRQIFRDALSALS
jgi:hypothetical protein